MRELLGLGHVHMVPVRKPMEDGEEESEEEQEQQGAEMEQVFISCCLCALCFSDPPPHTHTHKCAPSISSLPSHDLCFWNSLLMTPPFFSLFVTVVSEQLPPGDELLYRNVYFLEDQHRLDDLDCMIHSVLDHVRSLLAPESTFDSATLETQMKAR